MHRIVLVTLAAIAVTLGISNGTARARDFPTRSVTLIVPWPAGGTTDIAIRALATATEKYLGQSITIVNRPGVSGTLGPMQMAATATPDGYTISQIPMSLFRAPFMRQTTFDPLNDLTYIIGLSGYTFGVAVRSDASWKTFEDLVADAKLRPGKITYGSPGIGTEPHIVMAQIAQVQDVDWVHIPFKGTSETITAVLGGDVDVIADGSAWGPLVTEGKLRLLATFGAARTANWPTVPTLREIGINLVAIAPYGVAGPKDLDPKIVQALHDAFRKGMMESSYVAAINRLGQEPYYMNSEDYRTFATQEMIVQKRVVEELGLNSEFNPRAGH
jgi:tripartite-type tricarboxylate transporter receptor subunit TctC